MKTIPTILCALILSSVPAVRAHNAATEMADAAKDFLATLSEDQKAKAHFDRTADPERENWAFVPRPFEGEGMRGGLTLKDMRGDQKHLAYGLLSTGMSHRGYLTALQIMSLEQVLFEMENADHRDTEMYYFSIFGDPGSDAWGWRVEGHHISLNFTIADGQVASVTPNFFASNPAKITEGPRKGLRVLAAEEDVARKLIKSLSDDQRAKAIFEKKAPREILTEAKSTVESLGDAGIPSGDLDEKQTEQLKDLIRVYAHRVRPEVAEEELAKIDKEMDKVVFAWAGGLEMGEQHYYRVQGPSFLLEYANTQNNAYHVHAVWRDFDGDFGRDVLSEHYQKDHKAE